MDPLTVGLISGGMQAAGGIFGGIMGAQGQQETNAKMIAANQEAAQFNAHQADIARRDAWAFSGSQFQRAAGDLEAAGLNRILALGNPAGGASGAMGSAIGSPALGNPGSALQAGITSAGDAVAKGASVKATMQAADQAESQTKLNDAQTGVAKQNEELVKRQQTKTDQETATSKSAEGLNAAATLNKVVEAGLMNAQASNASALAKVNERIAADTTAWGDSHVGKAVGSLMRILGTVHKDPSSAKEVDQNKGLIHLAPAPWAAKPSKEIEIGRKGGMIYSVPGGTP